MSTLERLDAHAASTIAALPHEALIELTGYAILLSRDVAALVKSAEGLRLTDIANDPDLFAAFDTAMSNLFEAFGDGDEWEPAARVTIQ